MESDKHQEDEFFKKVTSDPSEGSLEVFRLEGYVRQGDEEGYLQIHPTGNQNECIRCLEDDIVERKKVTEEGEDSDQANTELWIKGDAKVRRMSTMSALQVQESLANLLSGPIMEIDEIRKLLANSSTEDVFVRDLLRNSAACNSFRDSIWCSIIYNC